MPIAPPVRVVTVYPALPSTTCQRPPALPTLAGLTGAAREAAFAAWFDSEAGRTWLTALRAGAWDCYDKLDAVHAEQMRWPAAKEN